MLSLGKSIQLKVDRRITSALAGAPLWALCGGPPCQAFSVVGQVSERRHRRTDDHRVYLYRQYLRILSVHEPPVFIWRTSRGCFRPIKGEKGNL